MAINIRNGKQLVFSVCGQTVKAPFAMRSSNKNDGQNIFTPVAAVTTAAYGSDHPLYNASSFRENCFLVYCISRAVATDTSRWTPKTARRQNRENNTKAKV